MSTPRIAVALTAAFFASTASVFPGPHVKGPAKDPQAPLPAAAFHAPAPARAEVAWPPPNVREAASAHADVEARMELTSRGSHRLVVEKKGSFVHVQYREVESAGPDWAAIELRAGDRAPKGDVAVWESTDPQSLVTQRGVVRFTLSDNSKPEAVAAEPPRLGPRDVSAVRTCQAHEDGASGFAIVCRISSLTSGVRAIRPVSAHPLAGAWVWDLPKAASGARFVRIDLPLSAGGAEAGAIAYVHGAKGV